MNQLSQLEKSLIKRGYFVRRFVAGTDAAEYLDGVLDQRTIGIGGSATIQQLGLYTRLASHNTVFWHWEQAPDLAKKNAMTAEIYLTSANAVAVTGEIVNIDGCGNRVAATLFGHQKVYFVIGRNKIAGSYESAVWRARNVAAPKRARQVGSRTPCAVRADRCYDCKSPGRVCRGLVTLWGPMMGMEAEVILIEEPLGL